MCYEMSLGIMVLGFASTKVKLMSPFYKPFDRYNDPWHGVFCFSIFDGIKLSTANTKPILNLSHMSLTDM